MTTPRLPLLILAIGAIAHSGCAGPSTSPAASLTVSRESEAKAGQLAIRVTGWPARTVQATAADVERLDFSVSRSQGEERRASLERGDIVDGQASSVFTALEPGEWQVSLEAFDARNMRIGVTSNAAWVYPNTTNTIELSLVLEAHAAAPATGAVVVDGDILPDHAATLVELAELAVPNGAEGVAPLPDGRVLVSSWDQTFVVDASGVVSLYSTVGGPCVAGPDGRVYFASYGTLKVLDTRLPASDPGFLQSLMELEYGPSAESIWVKRLTQGSDGRIYVAEYDRISIVDPELPSTDPAFLVPVAGRGTGSAPIYDPEAIAVAPDGTVYFRSSMPDISRIDTSLPPADPGFVRHVAGEATYADQLYDGPGHLARFGRELGPMSFSGNRLLIGNENVVRVLDHTLPPEHPRYISKLQGPPGIPAVRTAWTIKAMAANPAGQVYILTESFIPGTPPRYKLLVYKPQ